MITNHRALSLAAASLDDCLRIVESLPGENRSLEIEVREARDQIIHLRDAASIPAPADETSPAQTLPQERPAQ